MKKWKKRMVALSLALVLTMGMTLTVSARTTGEAHESGEYSSGIYYADLVMRYDYTMASLSYTPESPSDATTVMVRGSAWAIDGTEYTLYNIGTNSCSDTVNKGELQSSRCNYYIGGRNVKYLAVG